MNTGDTIDVKTSRGTYKVRVIFVGVDGDVHAKVIDGPDCVGWVVVVDKNLIP